MFCSALWGMLCSTAHSPHQRPRDPGDPELGGQPGSLCLREWDHIGGGGGGEGMCELETLSCRHGGMMGVGIAETHPADSPFPAAAAALIEDCLEQWGFPPVNVLLRWKEKFIPPRVIASRLSVNSGETLHLLQVFRLSVAAEGTGP